LSERRYKLLLVSAHPVQYSSPVYRRMAQHPQLEIHVAYCSLQGAEAGHDPDFGVDVQWDVPMLEGYPWTHVPNKSMTPGLARFWGLLNPGLWKLVGSGQYDAVVLYTGYRYASFWIALAAARLHGLPVLFGTDAAALAPRDGRGWKPWLKRQLWPRLFGLATVVIVPSTCSMRMMRSLGIPEEKLVLTPYVVDNDWWTERAAKVDRAAVRRSWGVPVDAPVVLFCAKLQPWKRPLDLLKAFAQAGVRNSHLVFAGDGPLRAEVEGLAAALGLIGRVHFLGFVNQTQLPAVYTSSDVMVLPSDYEPFGVVVNEAMLCGCPVLVSDRVGAGPDLIRPADNGEVFPCRDVTELADVLRKFLSDPAMLTRMRHAARRRMETWSPQQNIGALVDAVRWGVNAVHGEKVMVNAA
jgi:glycosyltransferase involved in cell wall biosynthesis